MGAGPSSVCRSPASEPLAEARAFLAARAKPPESLGDLEVWAAHLAAVQHKTWRGGVPSCSVDKPALIIFAADHGSLRAHPQLSAYPREVTVAVFRAVAQGVSASAVLADAVGAVEVHLVDVGVDAPPGALGDEPGAAAHAPGKGGKGHIAVHVFFDRVANGTADSAVGPAMATHDLEAAMAAAGRAVARVAASGSRVVLLGEIGLGNTTAAAALAAALAPMSADRAAGTGTGLSQAQRREKVAFVARALDANRALAQVEGPRGWLRAVGGLELAAMAGAAIAAHDRGMVVVVDGYVACAAALAAVRMRPDVGASLFLAHRSAEQGAETVVAALVAAGAAPPLLDLRMRLGEGSGALAALPLLRAAASLFRMAALSDLAGGS